uniref:(California timema) hypothetical protein n=1 Tax=Timema californicum TaxID=61474 RepID=A0A7R9P914_TIMCA|nr:unnamed protein product [Timema californicum]
MYPRLIGEKRGETISEKTTLSTPDQDSNPNLTVTVSPVYCKIDALDYSTINAGGVSSLVQHESSALDHEATEKKRKSGVKKSDIPEGVKKDPSEVDATDARKDSVSAELASSRKGSSAIEGSSDGKSLLGADIIPAKLEDVAPPPPEETSGAARRASGAVTSQPRPSAFELFDLNGDGLIDLQDLKHTFITLGQNDVTDGEIMKMLSEASEPLDFDSFVNLLGFKTVELDPQEVLLEALSKWDYESNGLISEERIKHDLMTWGDKFTTKEEKPPPVHPTEIRTSISPSSAVELQHDKRVEIALEDAPLYVNKNTGDGMIDYVKFCKNLCGLRKKTRDPTVEDFMKH